MTTLDGLFSESLADFWGFWNADCGVFNTRRHESGGGLSVQNRSCWLRFTCGNPVTPSSRYQPDESNRIIYVVKYPCKKTKSHISS